MTDRWIDVGKLEDVPRQGARCIKNGETDIAIFRTVDDQFFALEDKCPHKGGPLSQGIVHDCRVTCPLHNWVLDLKSGEAVGADEGKVRTIPVMIKGDHVLISPTSERVIENISPRD